MAHHVSSKYLDLTKKKLELTRLPHERRGEEEGKVGGDAESEQMNEEGVVTKKEIEGLIDYWQENYSWRTREDYYNSAYPQYRTTFTIPKSNSNAQEGSSQSLRIHFIHIRSSHANAVPLLLVPSFPNSNLSLDIEGLSKELCEPEILGENDQEHGSRQRREHKQAFDVVIPSIPGTGFSDEIPGSRADVMGETARLFGQLMKRLGYEYYIASMMGSGRERGGEVDYYLGRRIGDLEGCRGVHLIEPRWGVPTVKEGIWDWNPDENVVVEWEEKKNRKWSRYEYWLREPDAIAYALCDSPVGLLSFVATALKKKNPKHQLSKEKIIDLCQLCWLPGPEAALRYYANAVQESEQLEGEKKNRKRQRVAITVFNGEETAVGYSPPAWGMGMHEVVFVQRASGKAGLLEWERSNVIFEGIRGLANEAIRLDDKIQLRRLEGVVVDRGLEHLESSHGMQLDVESPDTIVAG
ncbi:epoxide hydrolase [Botrytis cinerea]